MKRGKSATRIQSFPFNKKILNSKRSNSRLDFVIRKNILSKSKRSQANIITVVLVILIVIVSLIIVWNLVQPLVKRTTGDISIGRLTLDLEIDASQTQLGNFSTITIARGSGKGDLTGIKFVFTNGVNGYVFTNDTVVLKELETKTYGINLTGNLVGVTGVQIYPIIETEAGNELIGGVYDSFGSGFS